MTRSSSYRQTSRTGSPRTTWPGSRDERYRIELGLEPFYASYRADGWGRAITATAADALGNEATAKLKVKVKK